MFIQKNLLKIKNTCWSVQHHQAEHMMFDTELIDFVAASMSEEVELVARLRSTCAMCQKTFTKASSKSAARCSTADVDGKL